MKFNKLFILTMMFLVFWGSVLLCGDSSKYEKTYTLNYTMKKNTKFTVKNNFYYIQYQQKKNEAEKFFQFASGGMALKYSVIDITEKGIVFEVEYKDKQNENYFKKKLNKKDYSKFLGGKIRYTLSSKGTVSDFLNFDKLNRKLSNGEEVSIDNLQEELIHLFPFLPEKPVKLGDSWTASFGGENGQESFSLKYFLLDELKIDGMDCLKIKANYTTENEYSINLKNGGKAYLKSKDNGHDIYYFAYKKGMVIMRKSIGNGITDILWDKTTDKTEKRTNDVLYETNVVFK